MIEQNRVEMFKLCKDNISKKLMSVNKAESFRYVSKRSIASEPLEDVTLGVM